ncbi:MAG: YicC/YloC family endoribonuclease [Cryomorphaceae bacterium]|nr:YicC family protein [Flavobacteriales bacterium]
MLESMTGFGKATASFGDKKITVEIKSLNSKLFDLSTKLPGLYREKELALRNILSRSLGRGKVDLTIYAESGETEKRASVNKSLALAYLREIKGLADAGGLATGESTLSLLLNMPEVLQTERPELSPEEADLMERTVEEAAEALLAFRRNEGARLAEDIGMRVRSIESLRVEVEAHLADRLQQVRDRIEKNIAEVMSSDEIDRNRMEQEIIYYLEKLDITEEHTRLKGHCDFFLETMDSPDAAGKKLGFISQEIGREINTMGAKANHVAIQRLVVQMKDELEKIKEQLLNIN